MAAARGADLKDDAQPALVVRFSRPEASKSGARAWLARLLPGRGKLLRGGQTRVRGDVASGCAR